MATNTLHVKPLSPKPIASWPTPEVEAYFKKSFELAKQERATQRLRERVKRFFGMN